MNWVYSLMILISIVYSFASGSPQAAADAMLNGAAQAVTLCISLLGTYILWMGILGVAEDAGLVDTLSKAMRPVVSRLMPNAGRAAAPVTLNIAANMLGMGNAATPFGIEAMKQLDEAQPAHGRATNDMCMFICINASAVQLIPSTVIAMRAAAGSADPYCVVLPTLIATAASSAVAIFLCLAVNRR